MKILHRDPEGGSVILNPHSLVAMVSRSNRECAAVVIDGSDIVVSTVYGLTHVDIASQAGFCNPWFDAESQEGAETRMLCLMADKNGITLELWPWNDSRECPCDINVLKELFKRVSTHSKLARLVSRGYEVDIAIFDSGGAQSWAYDGSSIIDFRDGRQRPIAM